MKFHVPRSNCSEVRVWTNNSIVEDLLALMVQHGDVLTVYCHSSSSIFYSISVSSSGILLILSIFPKNNVRCLNYDEICNGYSHTISKPPLITMA
jgi:hypothetical protein